MAIAGLPPIGCLPIQITAKFKTSYDRRCIEEENLDALVYNKKLARVLPKIQSLLPRSKIVYADVYEPLNEMINNPLKFGKQNFLKLAQISTHLANFFDF